jgi:cyclopropane-fatty-acyl-phospholipid synthase
METFESRDVPTARSGPFGALHPGTGDVLTRAARSAVLAALERWTVGGLTVRLPDGAVRSFGRTDAEPHATLRVAADRVFRQLALHGDLGAGESYMAGQWRADDLPGFLELAIRNHEALGGSALATWLMNVPDRVRHWLRRNTRAGSRRNISAHYDLSNDLFALFLDPTLTYSSAIFAVADEPLEAAQERKFRTLADRVGLAAGDHVLEIGCGWGAFAIFAARTYGCRVTGITISPEQFALASDRVRAAGLQDRIDLRLCDYRDVRGRFDHLLSFEMLEAVGREHWRTFFEKCHEVLAPGGRIGIQTISMPDHRFEAYARRCDWIQKYIFPGGLLPSVSELCRAMMPSTPLTLRYVEDIGPHYAETLERWRTAFLGRLDEVRALGFDDRFIRMWDFYLASCQALFRTRQIGNLQLVLARVGE